MHFRTEIQKLKQEVSQATQVFLPGGGIDKLVSDIQKVMAVLDDNDNKIKAKIESVESSLRAVYEGTRQALDAELRKHTQDAVNELGRRIHEIEGNGEAQRALVKASENVLRVNGVEAAYSRIETALFETKTNIGEVDSVIQAAILYEIQDS